MTTETLGLIDAAAIVKLRDTSREDASDILENMTAQELALLARHLIDLVGIARTYRGNPVDEPLLPIGEWANRVISRQKVLEAPERPRPRQGRSSNRVHLREAFEAGPYAGSDPFKNL